ncbi:MAG: flagellar biosynthetic protein FliO [Oscillospiraceae bacterium]
MKILERINLGPEKCAVSVCGKCMVLGVTNGRVEKVHELEETEEELMKKDENGGNPTFKESFKIVFKDMLNKK